MSLFNKLFKKNSRKREDAEKHLDMIDSFILREFMKCESVYRHQAVSYPRFTNHHPATMGFLIRNLFPECEGKVKDAICLTMVEFGGGPETKRIRDPKAIEELQPIGLSLYKNDEGKECPIPGQNYSILIHFSDDAPIREVLFHLRGAGGFHVHSPYIRVSVMIPPLGKEEDLHSGIPWLESTPMRGVNCAADQFSFLIVEDHADNRKLLDQYETIEQEVKRKRKSDVELTELEQDVYDGFEEFRSVSGYLGYGKWLADQERWTDAYRQFVRVWNISHHILNNNPEDDSEWYYSLAYAMGRCLFHMGRLDEAAYFLGLAIERNKKYAADLDVVYAGLGDIRVSEASSHIQKRRVAELKMATEKPYESGMLTIGEVFKELFGAVPGSLTSMALCNDNEDGDIVICESKDVWNAPLHILAKDKTTAIIMFCPVGYITGNEADKSKLCFNSTFVVRVHKAQTGNDDELLRMTIMLPSFNYDSEKIVLRRENIPEGFSLIIGTSDTDIIGSDSLEHCHALAKSGRFLESIHNAKYHFNRLLSRWEELNEEEKEDFFVAAYQVGYGLMDFHMMEKAHYYLEIAAQCGAEQCYTEYLNCLSNSYDPRTISVIDSFMQADYEESTQEQLHRWKSFLKRRKAFLLVEAKKLEEAKVILNDLIRDPDPVNRKFAMEELAFIDPIGDWSRKLPQE